MAALVVVVAGLLACNAGESEKEKELRQKEQELKQREDRVRATENAQAPTTTPAPQVTAEPAQPAAPRPAAPAGPREVTIKVGLAIDITKPGGKPWDVGGDAADPLLTIVSSGGQTGSASFKDQLNVATQFKMKLSPGDTVTVTAVDQDLAANDPIGSFSAKYTGAGSGGKGRNGGGSFAITFQ